MNQPDLDTLKTAVEVAVQRADEGPAWDSVINEVPVALQYNGISHAVMLCTPNDLVHFGMGFSLTEGIVQSPAQIFDITIEPSEAGLTVVMEIAGGPFMNLKMRRRAMVGRTGCGLCGVDSLDAVERDIPVVTRESSFPVSALTQAARLLPEQQVLQRLTGAAHAACHVNMNGEITHLKEDVGRHNALDKCLGSLAMTSPQRSGAIMVTSRASLEMVQKTAALGFGILAAISAPTAAAVNLANRLGVTLIGFLRGEQYVVYTHPEYLDGFGVAAAHKGYRLSVKRP
jgi:FdhD protein